MRRRPWSESYPRRTLAPPTKRSGCPTWPASLCPRQPPVGFFRTFSVFSISIHINRLLIWEFSFWNSSSLSLITLRSPKFSNFNWLLMWSCSPFPQSSSNPRYVHPFADACDIPILWSSLHLSYWLYSLLKTILQWFTDPFQETKC